MDNIRTRWENRIRKFTYPLQNTYSVVLRASNFIDNGYGSSSPSSSAISSDLLVSNDQAAESSTDSVLDKQTNQESQADSSVGPGIELSQPTTTMMLTPNVKVIYHQSSSGTSPIGSINANPQANQLFRMAALAMMSKLFSALRSQGKIYFNLN